MDTTNPNHIKRYPAHFYSAINFIIDEIEGDESAHPNDTGGYTKYGISSASFPLLDIKNLTREEAIDIYYEQYWKPIKCNQLPPKIAIFLFDSAINHGKARAVTMLQMSILGLAKDGIIGPITLAAARKADQETLMMRFHTNRIRFYFNIAERRRNQKVFLNGWLNRVYIILRYLQGL